MKYCESIYQTKRWKSREVMVGNVGVGGNNPVRIQSMTTSDTRDVQATINQIIRLADAGCEIARITVQGIKEADACEGIKNGLIKRGYLIPIVADIHFYPPAAMRVIDFVDKVRVNPGNFVDKRAIFKTVEYDDHSYAKEILKIEEKFTPLVEKCRKLKRAMRIGTNHGSLSDRIMNRYGDTPSGMVEAALEFARVCRKNDYHDFIFSMKASNPQVMVQAYRLLVAEMIKLGWDYPLHLGVTEAGEGEDGRIKSAMGIGSLLLDGLGDTIRVSLTEDPWQEIDPCKRLVKMGEGYQNKGIEAFNEKFRKSTEIKKRPVTIPAGAPLHRDGSVLITIKPADIERPDFFEALGCDMREWSLQGTIKTYPKKRITTVDAVILKDLCEGDIALGKLKALQNSGVGIISAHPLPGVDFVPLLTLGQLAKEEAKEVSGVCATQHLTVVKEGGSSSHFALIIESESPEQWEVIAQKKPSLILLAPSDNCLHASRRFFEWVQQRQLDIPVILHFAYTCAQEDLAIHAGAEAGALLCDGLGDGLCVQARLDIAALKTLSFNMLQAARMRSSKTEFISCPGCGRTLFNLQEVTKKIHTKTSHLPGVKIAIMGCIVNGPGEMADADFGYVGSKAGMVDLYVGKECVERNIPFDGAEDRLVALIKSRGRWVEVEALA